MRCIGVLLIAALVSASPALADTRDELFPRPASLEPAVAFWKRIYTEVDTRAGLVHDNLNLGIVYETLEFGENDGPRQRRRTTARAAEKYQEILTKLGRGERSNLNAEEARVLALWPSNVSHKELAAAASRVRFQLGQADRFRAGLIRSGAFKPYIYAVLHDHGLPPELAALPHVESSFDPTAYSRVGAAGLWQFTRSTGLRYMRIDHIVDERRDPYLSTNAAARLLGDNYAVIESWPLAITAYNHGLAGMRRAAARLDTKDIGVIVADYDGRAFGFASRNFYAAFLAAVDIDADPEKYFGKLPIAEPADYANVTVPDYVSADVLAETLGMSPGELARLNPALMEAVWEGDKFVPRGFALRLPAGDARQARERLSRIPAEQRFAAQQPDLYHRVRSGDTLSQIADRYHVSLASLVRINGLRSRNFIRIGQVLTLPISSTQPPPSLAEAATQPAPVPQAEGVYIVRRGDSIDRIARRLGVSAAELLAENRLQANELIFPGQSLRLPGTAPDSQAPDIDPGIDEAPEIALVASQATPAEPVPATEASSESEAEAQAIASTIEVIPELAADGDTLARVASDEAADSALEAPDNALASAQAELAADPSDYSVADNDTIEVQALETLGHYADWLGIRTQRLRDINGISFGQAVVIGQRVRLDFSTTDRATFEERRIAYQRERQESFFSSYQIEDITDHVIRPGESLWILAQRTYNVPVWLLRQYNPDLNLDHVSPGMVVKFPHLRRIAEPSSSATVRS